MKDIFRKLERQDDRFKKAMQVSHNNFYQKFFKEKRGLLEFDDAYNPNIYKELAKEKKAPAWLEKFNNSSNKFKFHFRSKS